MSQPSGGVLQGVLALAEQRGPVEGLGGLQALEAALERLLSRERS